MGKLPSTILRRPCLAGRLPSTSPNHTPLLPSPTQRTTAAQAQTQVRHATFVPRSRRPYQFTQLVQLSDGSTFTVRTTSPLALYKSAKDSRNHILWNPTEKSLRNVEVDEAGKLAAFRERFGTAWDLDSAPPEETAAAAAAALAASKKTGGQKGAAAAAAEAAAAAAAEGDKKVEAKDAAEPAVAKDAAAQTPAQAASEDPFASLTDLISAFATEDKSMHGGLSAKDQARKDKSKKK
jgi:hypothetical protein